jgi:hypothetical protein
MAALAPRTKDGKNMGSSGKNKTTWAKLARESRLRERRLNKQAKKDARKQASCDHLDVHESPVETRIAQSTPPDSTPAALEPGAQPPAGADHEDAPDEAPPGSTVQEPSIGLAPVGGDDLLRDDATSDPSDERASAPGHTNEEVRPAFRQVDPEPTDPRAKEVALDRLRDAPDEELAVFEGKLRDDALEAGATEREMRDAQRNHPGHGA